MDYREYHKLPYIEYLKILVNYTIFRRVYSSSTPCSAFPKSCHSDSVIYNYQNFTSQNTDSDSESAFC